MLDSSFKYFFDYVYAGNYVVIAFYRSCSWFKRGSSCVPTLHGKQIMQADIKKGYYYD